MFKKYSALAIAVVMVLTMCVTAFAASDTEKVRAGQFGTLTGRINTSGGKYSSTVSQNDVGATLYAGAEIQDINGSTLREDSKVGTGTRTSGSLGWPSRGYAMYGAHYIDEYNCYTYTNTN